MTLYDRIVNTGTIAEPKGVPKPEFALPSTINWMRSLAIALETQPINYQNAKAFYSNVQRRKMPDQQENTIFEQLLFALHQCSALHALCKAPNKADVARVGIVTWYYGIYAGGSAMVTAQDGSFQDDHSSTAAVWDKQIASRGYAMQPFELRLPSLVKKETDLELERLLNVPRFALSGHSPTNNDEAYAARHGYLSGSANWWRWKTEENIRSSSEFRALKVDNFRSKVARDIRDNRLKNRSIGFLHQASRYRGKANYREALFLGYGSSVETTLAKYVDDLAAVLDAFVCAAGVFCSLKIGKTAWEEFVSELEEKRSFSFPPSRLWK